MKLLNSFALLALAIFTFGCASVDRGERSPGQESPKTIEEITKQSTQQFFENTRQGPR